MDDGAALVAVVRLVRITALIPFFAGESSATHSKTETRLDYLRQTVESLRELGVVPFVFQTDREPSAKVSAGIEHLRTDPVWLPYAACIRAQDQFVNHDLVLVTEADHVWHVADEAVFDIPNDKQYLAPWRLDLVGPNGEMENPGSPTHGKYAIANGAHHLEDVDDPWGVLPIYGNQAAFSGAFICTADFFKRIKFRKMRLLPVEHSTGFDANATGLCVKTATVDRCWVDHLSPRDRYQSASS